jgi:hypothetical protein
MSQFAKGTTSQDMEREAEKEGQAIRKASQWKPRRNSRGVSIRSMQAPQGSVTFVKNA